MRPRTKKRARAQSASPAYVVMKAGRCAPNRRGPMPSTMVIARIAALRNPSQGFDCIISHGASVPRNWPSFIAISRLQKRQTCLSGVPCPADPRKKDARHRKHKSFQYNALKNWVAGSPGRSVTLARLVLYTPQSGSEEACGTGSCPLMKTVPQGPCRVGEIHRGGPG